MKGGIMREGHTSDTVFKNIPCFCNESTSSTHTGQDIRGKTRRQANHNHRQIRIRFRHNHRKIIIIVKSVLKSVFGKTQGSSIDTVREFTCTVLRVPVYVMDTGSRRGGMSQGGVGLSFLLRLSVNAV